MFTGYFKVFIGLIRGVNMCCCFRRRTFLELEKEFAVPRKKDAASVGLLLIVQMRVGGDKVIVQPFPLQQLHRLDVQRSLVATRLYRVRPCRPRRPRRPCGPCLGGETFAVVFAAEVAPIFPDPHALAHRCLTLGPGAEEVRLLRT